jgi:TRIAD3 protein (E3 ubiquitin-protein ligase RNF216)
MLAQEFPLIPMNHVRKVLGEKKRAYHAFLALQADDNLDQNQRPYAKLKKSRISPAQKFSRAIRDTVTIEIVAARRETRNLEGELSVRDSGTACVLMLDSCDS